MGYKEYVESCIMESGLDETDELLEILESAETMEDVEAVEEYLTEKKANPDAKPKKSRELSLRDVRKLDGVDMRTRLSSPYTSVRDKVGRRAVGKADVWNAEEADNAFDKASSNFDKGAIAVGATALLAAIAGVTLKVRKIVKNANSAPAKQIEKQIKELEKQAQDVAKRCKAGEITAKEAKVETKKIQAQIKKLAKDAAKIADAEAKETNESVDITNLQLEIFEACESGTITEDDRDELLELLND